MRGANFDVSTSAGRQLSCTGLCLFFTADFLLSTTRVFFDNEEQHQPGELLQNNATCFYDLVEETDGGVSTVELMRTNSTPEVTEIRSSRSVSHDVP